MFAKKANKFSVEFINIIADFNLYIIRVHSCNSWIT
jgi:hypothetical protein